MTGGPASLVLDNEAVQALHDPRHRKHRRALAFVEAMVARGRRGAAPTVPTAVRVEAGWDRRAVGAAVINRLRVTDAPLDRADADVAASLVAALRISVADAHLGATLAALHAGCAVVTSDVADVRRLAAYLDAPVTVVAL